MSTPTADTLGIIGAGAFGTALADVVASSGRTVWLDTASELDARAINDTRRHERLPGRTLSENIRATASVAEVCAHARLLVLAVSSRRAREIVPALGRVATGAHAVVHAIGSLVVRDEADGGALVRVSELVRAHTPVRRIGVLVGPAQASDLAERRPAVLVVASTFAEVVSATQHALSAPPALRVYGSRDLIGAEIASALAGSFTLGLGVADVLGVGAGPRAALVTRAMAEGARLLHAAGGQTRTMAGLAGLGNVLARSSPGGAERSDDYQIGALIARSGAKALEGGRASEGLRTLPSLLRLADGLRVRLPILKALHAAIFEGVSIPQAIGQLLDHRAEEE